ncbi:hypothetical protein BDV96DRAFT_596186 [Lophiotrema nucula]|uniref:Uncharacterized protein n=1 Tax=Lophiotrema nucula TaxID=690887 RepID=A0A6A5ZM00_9PLEO|nr:hypothetical protein BDV96DRAFT_596186 [Lophiotrema nucula]
MAEERGEERRSSSNLRPSRTTEMMAASAGRGLWAEAVEFALTPTFAREFVPLHYYSVYESSGRGGWPDDLSRANKQPRAPSSSTLLLSADSPAMTSGGLPRTSSIIRHPVARESNGIARHRACASAQEDSRKCRSEVYIGKSKLGGEAPVPQGRLEDIIRCPRY